MTEEIQRWADKAMFHSEPVSVHEDGVIVPKVHLLWMTPDPLGAAAALNMMYVGKVVRNLATDVTDADRRQVLEDMSRTRLTTPLEAIRVHFMVENVTRSFTHQMVRQRTAAYAQESMRFAVVDQDDWTDRCAMPPSINTERRQQLWNNTVEVMQEGYKMLIEDGVPAEDARGLMPHAMTTRLNYVTDLRNMVNEAGKRLCTQAQFEWRVVFLQIVEAIRNYCDNPLEEEIYGGHRWQFEAIADSWMFRPVCYHTGRCEFMAQADRFCTIRERVQAYHEAGVRPEDWDARDGTKVAIRFKAGSEFERGIFPAEWLVDPTAAREESPGGTH